MPINIASNTLPFDPGAWCVPTYKGKFMLLKRDDGLWDFPGGHVEKHESPKQGAIRELYEEAKIVVHPDDMVLIGSGIIDGYYLTLYSFEIDEVRIAEMELDKEEHSSFVWTDSVEGYNLNPPTKVFLEQGWIDKIL